MDGVVDSPVGTDGIPDEVQDDPNGGSINYIISDTDGDGIPNHQDLDADDDGCNDVTEAQFSDDDSDGLLGLGTPTVNQQGVVVSVVDGYTQPTNDYIDRNLSLCIPLVDLGEDGSGTDHTMTFVEDDAATNVLDSASIQDANNDTFSEMSIVVAGVLDMGEELLIIEGMQFSLSSSASNPVTVRVNEENVNITFIDNVFSFYTSTGDARLDFETCEEILEKLQYQHTNRATPKAGNRVLTVTVSDGSNISHPSTITIQVVPVNDNPVAENDTISIEALTSAKINIVGNDFDIDSEIDLESINLITVPLYGSVYPNSDGTITYQGDLDESTVDSLTYTIADIEGGVSNIGIVYIQLMTSAVNESPEANPDVAQIQQGDTLIVDSMLGLLSNDTDPESDQLTLISILYEGGSYPLGTTVSLPQGALAIYRDGSYSFFPNPSFLGTIQMEYQVSDGQSTANSTLTITVVEQSIPSVGEVEVSMIITRNNDGLNDYLKIENIDAFPENSVFIFNRWGNKVWQTKGYENLNSNKRFEGIGNTSSAGELPDGTYFYVIEKGDGSGSVKGFLTLKH
ncbi:MAG: tandem-95 repeat protein [Ekhidna sp.]|nr:tandem-95 repeat protein [Ekhidna sp.]